MSEPDESRRIDLEVLAWMLAAGIVGIAGKTIPFLLASKDAPEGVRSYCAGWLAQELAIVAVAVPIGLVTAQATRLGARDVRTLIAREPRAGLRIAVGVFVAMVWAAVVAALVVFAPRRPHETNLEFGPAYVALSASMCIGAALNEEIVFRLGLMTCATWVAAKATRRPAGNGHVAFGLLVSALVFGGMHMPMKWSDALQIVKDHPFTLGEIMRTIWYQVLMGLVCGWLYWTRGIVAAIAAHAFTNVFALVVEYAWSR